MANETGLGTAGPAQAGASRLENLRAALAYPAV
jgi:hypothetical protein